MVDKPIIVEHYYKMKLILIDTPNFEPKTNFKIEENDVIKIYNNDFTKIVNNF